MVFVLTINSKKPRFNQSGQGSGVFQLLISAVVAMAILGVLLNILGVINVTGSQDASTTAKNTLEQAYNNIGTPKTSTKIQMKKDDIISSVGVAGRELGISPAQVLLGYATPLEGLIDLEDASEGAILTYKSSSARDIRIASICDDAARLEEYVESLSAWAIAEKTGGGYDIDADTGCFVGIIVN